MKKKCLLFVLSLIVGVNTVSAQGLFGNKNILESIKGVVGDVAADYIDFSIEGSWTYEGAAVKFESDNVAADLAASAAATSIENKISEQLVKLGIKPGSLKFVFNGDKTMSIGLAGRNISGTYEYDKESRVLNMKIARAIPIKSKVQVSNSEFSMLFDTKGLITFVKTVTGKINVSSLSKVSKLLDNYDEMSLGFTFSKN